MTLCIRRGGGAGGVSTNQVIDDKHSIRSTHATVWPIPITEFSVIVYNRNEIWSKRMHCMADTNCVIP